MSLRGQRTGQAVSTAVDRYLVAETGGVTVAFAADAVQGLLTPDAVPGGATVMVQGVPYPIVDVRRLLDRPADPETADRRVVLLTEGGRRVAVWVSRVHGLLEASRQQLLPLPAQFRGDERGWYAGLLLWADGVAAVLHTAWLVAGAAMTPIEQNAGSVEHVTMAGGGGV